MRSAFAQELLGIEHRLAREFDLVGRVLESLGETMLEPTWHDASWLVAAARDLRTASREVNEQLIVVVARQAPVAGDLRLVLSLIQLAQYASLIANQFELVSHQLDELDPDAHDSQQTAEQLALMAKLCGRQVRHAVGVFAARDLRSATELRREDDALDRLNRDIFAAGTALDGDLAARELAMRFVLIARCLERIGDNAVDIAEQAAFVVTGELTAFGDVNRATLGTTRVS